MRMYINKATLAGVALVLGLGWHSAALAASCCGGGGGSSLILPKYKNSMAGITLAQEVYDGFWDANRHWRPDPANSDLQQTRLGLAVAKRLSSNWQASIGTTYVWNNNQYSNNRFRSQGLGDSTISLQYEAFDDITCTYIVETWEDLKPAMYFGGTLTLPTGLSPYDDVQNNFDITGRGFYRLDLQALFDKTVYPWNASLGLTYGIHQQRSVNREYGVYVAPYEKKLGDKFTFSASVGYTWFLQAQDTITLTGAYADMKEDKAVIDGYTDTTSGIARRGFTLTTVWASADKSDVLKFSISHAPQYNTWGRNFPTTQTFSLGVSRAYD